LTYPLKRWEKKQLLRNKVTTHKNLKNNFREWLLYFLELNTSILTAFLLIITNALFMNSCFYVIMNKRKRR